MIIPVHNEARWIRELLERVLAQPDVGQLIVVDDASTDDSLAVIRRAVRRVPHGVDVTVIPVSPNQGKGAAVNRGLAAVNRPFVIIQDADLEYDPADYHQLLEPLVAGQTQVVFGSRFLTSRDHSRSSDVISNTVRDPVGIAIKSEISRRARNDGKDSPGVKETGQTRRRSITLHDAGNRFLSWYTSWLFGVTLTDMNTCYKCFDSTLISKLHCTERRFAWDPQLTAQLIRLGQGIVERPIRYRPRTIAEGKQLRWQDGFAQLWVLAREWLRYWPTAQWRLLVSLVAAATLIVGLGANQLATIERIKGKTFEIAEPLRLARSIPLDQGPHCHRGPGFIVAGPYVTVPPGHYRYQALITGTGPIHADADAGSPNLGRIVAHGSASGSNAVPLTLDVDLAHWSYATEFRIRTSDDALVCVRTQSLTRLSLHPLTALMDLLTPVRTSQLDLPPRQ